MRVPSSIIVGLALCCASAAAEPIRFSVTIDDPAAEFAEHYADIERLTLAAAEDWARYLVVPEGVSPDIAIRVDFLEVIGDASATSDSVWGLRQEGDHIIYRQGVAHEILTGEDINGEEPDALISLNPFSLENWFWFDPDPSTRTTPVPGIIDTDFYSLMLHELGHVLAFNGNLDEDGTRFGEWISEYDELVSVDEEGRLFFNGRFAMRLHGEPVQLTPGDYKHVGVRRSGTLENDVMHTPANCSIGGRCHISPLDLAILRDTGLQVMDYNAAPELNIERIPDGGMRLTWTEAFGPVRIQSTDSLESDTWTDVAGPLGGWTWETDRVEGENSRFYRIVTSD